VIARRSPRHDLVRVEGWEGRLAALANDWRHRPYAYGLTDCGRFMIEAVTAVTGEVLLEGVTWPRGWLGVAKFMIANGWDSVEDTMDDLLPPMEVAGLRRGDVVSFELGGEMHLAVRIGDTALTPGVAGLEAFGASTWRRAWRVG
jgi:hypothetical protein